MGVGGIKERGKTTLEIQVGKAVLNCCEGRSEMASAGLYPVCLPHQDPEMQAELVSSPSPRALCYAKQAPEVDWPNHLLETRINRGKVEQYSMCVMRSTWENARVHY